MMRITINMINRYKEYLLNEEKSNVTIEKYARDIRTFYTWMEGRELMDMFTASASWAVDMYVILRDNCNLR